MPSYSIASKPDSSVMLIINFHSVERNFGLFIKLMGQHLIRKVLDGKKEKKKKKLEIKTRLLNLVC